MKLIQTPNLECNKLTAQIADPRGGTRMDGEGGKHEQQPPQEENKETNPSVGALEIGQGANTEHSDKKKNHVSNQKGPSFLMRYWHRWCALDFSDQLMAFFTFVIACWAGLQWLEMHGSGRQTKDLIAAANTQASAATTNAGAAQDFAQSAQQSLSLQKTVAKLTIGAPYVHWMWTGAYYSKRQNYMWIQVGVQNDGKNPAESSAIAVNWDFLIASPSSPYKFGAADFRPTNPQTLSAPPSTPAGPPGFVAPHRAYCCGVGGTALSKQIAPRDYPGYRVRNLYVWGTIRYRDFTGDVNTQSFCRYAPGTAVFDADTIDANPSGGGYSGPWNDCETYQ